MVLSSKHRKITEALNAAGFTKPTPPPVHMSMADTIRRLIGHVPRAAKTYDRIERPESRAAQRRLRQIQRGQLSPSPEKRIP
jgi:hypothetical protein